MIPWIRRILGLCIHDWVDMNIINLFESEGQTLPRGKMMRQRCKKCGSYRQIDY